MLIWAPSPILAAAHPRPHRALSAISDLLCLPVLRRKMKEETEQKKKK
jgi:hypothetical protein